MDRGPSILRFSPSYMTEGIAEAIAANRAADKIFVWNIVRDLDIQEDNINDLAKKFMRAISRKGAVAVEWRDCVTHFFVQRAEAAAVEQKYIPFDPAKFTYPLETVRVRDWEALDGRHSGGFVLDELQQIVQARIDIELQRIQHMVSIIVPVLNEATTLGGVLRSLIALDFHSLGLTKEIIVVDGGSSDGSLGVARNLLAGAGVSKPTRRRPRCVDLRGGIEKARGSLTAFFPGDNEYQTSDLFQLVSSLLQSR